MFQVITFFGVLSIAYGLPNSDIQELMNNNVEPTMETAARAMGKDCSSGIFSPTCLKIGAISVLEKLNTKDKIQLIPGVSLVKESNESESAEKFAAELVKSLPTKPEERLDKYLLYRLGTYLDSHAIKLNLIDEETAEEARSILNESRGRKDPFGGKKGAMEGFLAMAMMMKGNI